MPNANGAGYYRFRLDDAGWNRLIAESKALSGPEALALADSVWSDFAAGPGNFARVIAAAKALSTHEERLAVLELGDRMHDLATSVLTPDQIDAYRTTMRDIYVPRLRTLGLDVSRGAHGSEPPHVQALRQSLLPLVAIEARDKDVRSKLSDAAVAYLGGDTKALDPAFRADAFAVAVQERGVPFMRDLRDALAKSTEPLFRDQAVAGLSSADTPELARAALEMSLSEGIHSLETAKIIYGISRQPQGREAAIELVEKEFERVMNTLPTFLRPRLSNLYARACTAEDVARVEAFFRPKLAEMGGGELELEQTKERIRACAAVRKEKQAEITAALAAK